MKKTAFFLGKGGVGKTTVSAAAAKQLADSGLRVLIVSLDPAHNLGDVFGVKLSNDKKPLAPNLDGVEVDLAVWVRRYLKESRDEIKANYTYQNSVNVDSYINILKYSPGTEEYAVLWAIEYIEKTEGPNYDLVIFDTPPTALSLRFLAMPKITEIWVNELQKMREAILKKRQTILRINPDAGILHPDENGGNPKGGISKENDAIYGKLSGIQARLGALGTLFAKESYMACVINPDELSLAEALRIRNELKDLGVALNGVCLNKYAPPLPLPQPRPKGEGSNANSSPLAGEVGWGGDEPVWRIPRLENGLVRAEDLAALDLGGLLEDIKQT